MRLKDIKKASPGAVETAHGLSTPLLERIRVWFPASPSASFTTNC